jgi:DNA-binding NtrC family response regulator
VSGIHGLLYPHEDSLLYFDLATRNGSYDARGARISIAKLLKNDSLRLGDKVVQVTQQEATTAKPVIAVHSAGMLELDRIIEKVAPSSAPVVIYGESGVGKELAAKSIHRRSGLHGPLVTANAACFTPQLARSELFGHVAGAFTGASRDRQGLFSSAHSGTLFLDEVAEMPLSVQAELLRAIETGLIHPLGASEPCVAQPRLIVASHKNLDDEVRCGRFRQDLYYRLCVIKLSIPPLRERPEDIEHLAKHFITEFCKGHALTNDVLQWLKVQPWNGNVRELRNLFWKASVLCPQRPTQLFNLKHLLTGNQSSRVVRDDVIRVFFELGEDIQETAKALRLHRSTVHRHIRDYRSELSDAA